MRNPSTAGMSMPKPLSGSADILPAKAELTDAGYRRIADFGQRRQARVLGAGDGQFREAISGGGEEHGAMARRRTSILNREVPGVALALEPGYLRPQAKGILELPAQRIDPAPEARVRRRTWGRFAWIPRRGVDARARPGSDL